MVFFFFLAENLRYQLATAPSGLPSSSHSQVLGPPAIPGMHARSSSGTQQKARVAHSRTKKATAQKANKTLELEPSRERITKQNLHFACFDTHIHMLAAQLMCP